MAETAPDSAPTTKPPKPSRLRNEMHFDTDDESTPDEAILQVPASDVVIPDSFCLPKDDGAEEPLSPQTWAVLERNEARKSRERPVSPLSITYLSKGSIESDNSLKSAPMFTFQQMTKATAKRHTGNENSSSSFTSPPEITPRVGVTGKETTDDHNIGLSNPNYSRPNTKQSPGNTLQAANEPVLGEAQTTMFVSTTRPTEQGKGMESSLCFPHHFLESVAAAPTFPPSASISGTVAVTRVQGKKCKKKDSLAVQPSNDSWPTRLNHAVHGQDDLLRNEELVLNILPDNDSSTVPTESLRLNAASLSDLQAQIPVITDSLNDELEYQKVPDTKSTAPNVLARTQPGADTPLPQSSRNTSLENVRKEFAQTKDREGPLHRTSEAEASCRVQKPQRKRAPCASPKPARSGQARNYGGAMHSPFERSLEALRVAFLAEKFQHEDALASANSKNESANAAQQDLIRLQRDMIEDWKIRYDSLEARFKHLSEKTKTNQKYVAGLRKDYEKLQGAALAHYNEMTKTLQFKITEIEDEKKDLESDLNTALDKVAKSQKSMRTVMTECYVNLSVSESKNKSLENEVKTLSIAYEAEAEKCRNMEARLLSTTQDIQHQLESDNSALVKKLEDIENSLNMYAAKGEEDSCLEECVAALQKLLTTPFLTSKDMHQAEIMLRHMHENAESKFGDLLTSVDGNRSLTEGITTGFCNQLRSLRDDLLKHEETIVENQKILHAMEAVRMELENQKEHSKQLMEQKISLQQENAQLQLNYSQLESTIQDLKGEISAHESTSLGHCNEIAELRHQMNATNEDLRKTKAELGEANHLRQEQESKAKEFEALATQRKAKLLEIADEAKMFKTQNSADVRANVEKKYRQIFEEQEGILQNTIHRLERNAATKEKSILDLNNELDATRDRVRGTEDRLRSTDSELKDVQKAKLNVEGKLKDAERVIQEHSNQANDLKQVKQGALEDTRGEVARLLQENASLKERLQNAQHQEEISKDVQLSLAAENEELERQLSEIEAAKDAGEKAAIELRDSERDHACKKEEDLAAEISDLRRRLTQSHVALKESEAKAKQAEAEGRQALQQKEEYMERRLGNLQTEWSKEKKELESRLATSRGRSQTHLPLGNPKPSSALKNSKPGKTRQTNSFEKSDTENPSMTISRVSGTSHLTNGNVSVNPDGLVPVVPGDPSTEGFFDEFLFDIADDDPDALPDTQQFSRPSVSFQNFVSAVQIPRSSSSSLDEITSEALHELEAEQQAENDSTSTLLSGKFAIQSFKTDNHYQPENRFLQQAERDRPQSRPRSQANMASRLVPSPKLSSMRSVEGALDLAAESSKSMITGATVRPSDTSSPDYVHRPAQSPDSKFTYSHHRPGSSQGDSFAVPQAPEQAIMRKRKRSSGASETATFSKNLRSSSQSMPSSMTVTQSTPFKAASTLPTQSTNHATPTRSTTAWASTKKHRTGNQKHKSSKVSATPSTQRSAMRSSQSRATDNSHSH